MATEWITWDEAANLVGCSRAGLYPHVRAGRIRHRARRVRRGSLDRASVEQFGTWLAQHKAERAAARNTARRKPSPSGPPDDTDIWLKTTTAALVLGYSPQYLGRLAAEERVPAHRRGHGWWFRRSDVEQLAAARTFTQLLRADHELTA
jgi:hypothetical protein